jgi:hypothetical protein
VNGGGICVPLERLHDIAAADEMKAVAAATGGSRNKADGKP